uniref:Uncharacterized protein n=1 Tax=Anopheles atroparvus TaxID=41427 RepID=A0A182J6U2_ANOAO
MMLEQVAVGVAAGVSVAMSSVRVSFLMVSVHLRMVGMSDALHVRLESVVLVRGVLHHSLSSVGLVQRVGSLDDISIPVFPLALVVAGVRVLNTVLELVARMRMVVLVFVVSAHGNGQQGEGSNAMAYEHQDYHSHPSYKFEYGVKDPHTGDHKSQWEHRDGDVVKGAYTLHEADGTERVVEYSSDKHNGFQAHRSVMIIVQVAVGVAAGVSVTMSSVRVSFLMVSVDFRMVSMSDALHVRLESVVLIRGVLHHSLSSIGLVQRVGSLDDVSIPVFPLTLVVAGVRILHAILELVARMRMVVLVFVVSAHGNGQQGEGGNGDFHHFGRVSLVLSVVSK